MYIGQYKRTYTYQLHPTDRLGYVWMFQLKHPEFVAAIFPKNRLGLPACSRTIYDADLT